MKKSSLIVAVVLIGVFVLGLANVATAAKKKGPKGVDLYKEYCKALPRGRL